jgi:glycerol transport system ATP-binding protein
VYENIASPLRVQRKPRAEIEQRVQEAAKLLKLEPYLRRTPLQLSGGQQQRTAIARALVKGADLVLLDEPLANLDYKLREELRTELPKIFEASGAIFVYATTEPSEALLLGGNTATLSQGAVTQFGETIRVYRHPLDLLTARTFADPPLNTIELVKSGAQFLLADRPVLPVPAHLATIADGPVTIGFQPHHLYLHRNDHATTALSATTLVSEIAGSESFIHLNFAGARWVMLAHGIHDIDPDHALEVFIDTRHLMAFGSDGRALVDVAAA